MLIKTLRVFRPIFRETLSYAQLFMIRTDIDTKCLKTKQSPINMLTQMGVDAT